MNAKAETQSISLEYDLPHPPEKVWRALTEPELLAAWLMVNDMRPLVGNSFTFKAQPTPWWDGTVHCEVLASRLDTVVTWTLTPTPSGGTRLALEHSGFLPANPSAFEGARQGWQRMVGNLVEVLAHQPG